MKVKKIFGLILLIFTLNAFASPIDSTMVKQYSDNESYWGFKLGRFHFGGEYFLEDGVSFTFLNEHKISKYFYLGGSLQVYKTIGSDEGAISLNGYLSYPFKVAEQKFFLKAGTGLATLNYLSPILYFEIEYIVCDFEKSAISVSVQQTFPKLPLIVTLGILF
jgi:hypothetical protein